MLSFSGFHFWTFQSSKGLEDAGTFMHIAFPESILAGFFSDTFGYTMGIYLREDQAISEEIETQIQTLGGEKYPL